MTQKTKKVLEKININMFEAVTEQKYQEAKNKYIDNYTVFEPGGNFFTLGKDVHKPIEAAMKWDTLYPYGFKSWKVQQVQLSPIGEQYLIDKINEIIDFLNS